MATTSRQTPARWPAGRDHSLTGPESVRAISAGLADAQWYRPEIAPARLETLMVRTNGRAARDTVVWLCLVVGSGALAYSALGSWWAVPAFLVYGALYGGAADARWHECGHGTAFRDRLPNDVVYTVASFMLLREPTLWRWSHVRHHSDTIVVGRDPEIDREIVSALRQQRRDPSWEIPDRWTPPVVTPDASVRPGARDDIDVHDLGAADELRPGQVRRIDIGDATYLLCRPAPDMYALTDGLCTHGHALLADGHLDGYIVECPKHNGRFDVRTGEPVRRPVKIPLTTHRVDVVDGRLVAVLSRTSAR